MALDTDLQFFRSLSVTDDGTNGGRMSTTSIPSGVEQNFWPHVFRAERLAGSTKYRKLFLKVNNDANDSVVSNRIFIDLPTPGGDYIVGFLGTDTDTQTSIQASARKYGAANIQSTVTSGTRTIIVTVEDVSLTTGNDQIFKAGDAVRISSKTTPDAISGDEEELTLETVSSAGAVMTLTTTADIVNTYTSADSSRVSSLYEAPNSVQATTTSVVATGGVTYDNTANPPILNNRGTVSQTLTLTFTDAANFTVSGDSLTGLPSGNTGTDYVVANPDFPGTNYITLESAGWGGTAAAGDTLVVVVQQAAIPFWFRRVVPAATGSLANNRTVTAWAGESV